MKTKQIVKILLDIVMAALFTVLVFGFGTSMFFHEVAGMLIFLLYIFHLILNGKWIKRSFKNLFDGSITKKNLLYLSSDVLLFVGMTTIIITGVLISQVLFSLNIVNDISVASAIHNYASYVSLGVLVLHIALHAKYLVNSFKKIFSSLRQKTVRRTAVSFAALLAAVAIIYSQVYSAYNGNLSQNAAIAYAGSNNQTTEYVTEEVTEQGNEASTETATTKTTTTETTTTETTTKKKDETTTASTTTTTTTTTQVAKTLNEYLGNLHCTGCGKHCSLLAPQCNRGRTNAQTATQEYYSTYGTEN